MYAWEKVAERFPSIILTFSTEELFRTGAHSGRVENMIVVAAIVEPHQLELEQLRISCGFGLIILTMSGESLELPADLRIDWDIPLHRRKPNARRILSTDGSPGKGFFLGLSGVG